MPSTYRPLTTRTWADIPALFGSDTTRSWSDVKHDCPRSRPRHRTRHERVRLQTPEFGTAKRPGATRQETRISRGLDSGVGTFGVAEHAAAEHKTGVVALERLRRAGLTTSTLASKTVDKVLEDLRASLDKVGPPLKVLPVDDVA